MSLFRATSSNALFMSDVPINFHSIIGSGLILERQSLSKDRQYSLCLLILGTKVTKDLNVVDLSVLRHAQYLHKVWKRHQDAEDCVDINLALTKGLKFDQTRSNATILHATLPAYCIPKNCGDYGTRWFQSYSSVKDNRQVAWHKGCDGDLLGGVVQHGESYRSRSNWAGEVRAV